MTTRDRNRKPGADPSVIRTLREDIRRGDFRRTVKRDFEDVREFFLDESRTSRLKQMGWIGRWIHTVLWLLKGLFLKLTPARRILLIIGVVITLSDYTITFSDHVGSVSSGPLIGVLLILFVLMLELKDKLVARDELMAGRAIQRALMPRQAPTVPGCDMWLFTRPANEVGGDLLDYVEIAHDRIVVAIGDIAGKGLRAALYMAKLQASVRALMSFVRSVSELGTSLNQIFFRDKIPNMFASLIVTEIQPDSHTVHILNAGHMPPIVLKQSCPDELAKGGPALGLFQERVYEEQRVELSVGEALVLYSDGVTEALNQEGMFFGEDRFRQLLCTMWGRTAAEIGTGILSAVDVFVGDARPNDDLTLVILRPRDQ